jgi:CRP-like cAMP-binding protein
LAERGDVRRLQRGEILIHQGELSESLLIMLIGQLKVFTRDDRGRDGQAGWWLVKPLPRR